MSYFFGVFKDTQTLFKSCKPNITKMMHAQSPNQIQFDSTPAYPTQTISFDAKVHLIQPVHKAVSSNQATPARGSHTSMPPRWTVFWTFRDYCPFLHTTSLFKCGVHEHRQDHFSAPNHRTDMKLFVYDPNTSKNECNFFQVCYILKNWQKSRKTEFVSSVPNKIGLKNHKENRQILFLK